MSIFNHQILQNIQKYFCELIDNRHLFKYTSYKGLHFVTFYVKREFQRDARWGNCHDLKGSVEISVAAADSNERNLHSIYTTIFIGEKNMAEKKVRKNLIKLIPRINMFNLHCTAESPEYKYLDPLLSDQEVDALLHLKVRKPVYTEDVPAIFELSPEEAAKIVERLTRIGILEYTWDDNGKEQIKLPIFAPGNMENFLMIYDQSEEHPEASQAFSDYVIDLQEKYAQFFPNGKGLARVIPVEKAIEAEPKKLKMEELSYWVEKYAPSLSVAVCQCRRARRIIGEGTGDPEDEWCIELGKYAESCIKTGRARRITKEECYDILERAEELGYVHEVTNVDGCENSLFICNCAWDTCLGLRTSWWTNTPSMSRSNFVAEVTPDKCMACGQCVEVCPENAVKLGEKLCQKEPVKYQWMDIPENNHWSKKHWRTDLLTTRENVWEETGTSPCKTECPAHVAVQAYLRLAGEGRYREALELIKKENPFPAVCGRVCNRRCELACTRGDVDQAVAIDEVKKFVADQDLNSKDRYVPSKMYPNSGSKIAVIGSGPAGLSCAYYLAVYGHHVTVYEKQAKLGGMMTMGIPSFRLEKNVVEAEIDILKELGVQFVTNTEVGKDITIQQLREEGFKGFYIGIGLQDGGHLNIPGDDADGVMAGIDFMKKVNGGEKVVLHGTVVVIGGGNIGSDVARTAVRCGADKVKLYCLESYEEMPMGAEDRTACEEEGIEIHAGYGQTEILKNGTECAGIRFRKCLSVKDANGKFNPRFDDAIKEETECSYVLFCIGQKADWGHLIDGLDVKRGARNLVMADPFTYETAEKDIFAGGDIFTGQKFCIDAIAAGKQGAVSLNRAVREGHSLILGRDRRKYQSIDKEKVQINLNSFENTPRQKPACVVENRLTFQDEKGTFTTEQVKKETSRCLSCGAAHVDQNICFGCGLCTTRCKFDAIHLRKATEAWGTTYEKYIPAVAQELVQKEGRIIRKKLRSVLPDQES